MRIGTILTIIAFINTLNAQNLVPNGSFESATGLNYMDPADAFSYLDDWYSINYYPVDPLYRGTPDLFDFTNQWPPSNPANFWNAATGAYEGDLHIGIANHLKFEGYSTPEAVATTLVEPLEAGEFYHIELLARNKGVAGYLDFEPILCVPVQYKQIEILLNPDSILVTIDDDNKDSYVNAATMIQLRSDRIENELVGSWHPMGTCFQADGTEHFFAISTSSGRFDVNPPCVIEDDHWNAFYIYYYDIDDVKLTKLPEEFIVNQTICSGRPTKFNIDDLVDLPVMQSEIEYHWENGTVDSVNYLSQAGTYLIDAVLDCKTISITLEVTDLKCEADIYIPNAFSPNGDGINDYLETFLSIDIPVTAFRFSVYDRWGAQVFSTNNSDVRWDGSAGGRPLDTGVYIWLLEYTIDDIELGTISHKESGDVTLIR